MLHGAMKCHVERAKPFDDRFLKATLVQEPDRLSQSLLNLTKFPLCTSPGRFALVCYQRPIFLDRKNSWFSLKPFAHQPLIADNVQNDFPYAMDGRRRLSSGLFGSHIDQ